MNDESGKAPFSRTPKKGQEAHTGCRKTPNPLLRQLNARLDKAIRAYHMLQDNDQILVTVSGGADSMSLLWLLSKRFSIYAKNLQLYALYIDMGFGTAVEHRIEQMNRFSQSLQVKTHVIRTQIGPYGHSDHNTENPCFLCTRIRRKHIFAAAEKLGCNKIVFGHHKDDLVETLLINMIFGREISTCPPMLRVKDGRYHLLRPLAFVEEALLKRFAEENQLPIFSQDCPSAGHSQRQFVKELVTGLEVKFPGARDNIFFSMAKVKKDYLL